MRLIRWLNADEEIPRWALIIFITWALLSIPQVVSDLVGWLS